jgi:SAM-dependent methyltransferase
MMTSEHAALLQKADLLEKAGQMSSYTAGMWRHVVSSQAAGTHDAGENNDSLPYVPVIPEDYGVRLTGLSRVLDVGCLGGYGLYDFAVRRKTAGLELPVLSGMDSDPLSVASAVSMAELWAPGGNVSFCPGKSEHLPYAEKTFDLVVCRLVLPYVRVVQSVSEAARVLRDDAIVVFQVHSPSYYTHRLLACGFKLSTAAYYLRPIISYLMFRISGRQPSWKWFAEMAMDTKSLMSVCASSGLVPVWQSETRRKPMMVFRKTPDAGYRLRAPAAKTTIR